MVIFGSIGIFVKYITLPSSIIAMTRGIAGALCIWALIRTRGEKPDLKGIKKNLMLLVLSGIAMGFNWVFLFESYNYTTVAVATLCYYMQPVFLTIASPFALKEKLTARKLICVFVALAGMVFVSGVLSPGGAAGSLKGVVFGITAGVLYTVVVLLTKLTKDVDEYSSTSVQLLSAGAVMLIYCPITVNAADMLFTPLTVALLAVVCFIHTGIAYSMYFGSVHKLPAQTVAIFGYIDPIVSIILSILFLKETFTLSIAIGAVLILGATFFSERNTKQ